MEALVCSRCGEPKKRRRGVVCSACSRLNYKEKNRKRIAEKAKKDYWANPEKAVEKRRLWRKNNTEHYRIESRDRMRRLKDDFYYKLRAEAVKLVNQAIKYNRLQRLSCEVCGEGKTQAHHDSYLEKDLLNVRFLCIRHHKEWHRFNKPIYPQIGEQSKITR